ncbi:MAG: beta-galactosidase [Planctomycetes bacterium]|nr:beta-galactosidase [Planctomycetota bacterium]
MRNFSARLLVGFGLLTVILLHAGQVWAAEPPVTVTPEDSDEILANPGMGWQTFHRTRTQDNNLPSWIPSTVHYARWGWGTLEPDEGKIDYDFLDGVLSDTREAGQKVAFRVMCCSTYPRRPYHPQWLRDIRGGVVTTRYGDGPQLEVPVLDESVVLKAHLDFIKRLGARYDGHPDIDHIDLGSVGWWGEWHMSQSSNAPMLKHATQHGTGWRADCLGDMGGFSKTWCHMRMAYPQRLPQADAMDAWKTAPVAWETCWDMRKWVDEGWSLRYIVNYALALHGSYINNKSAPLPEREHPAGN